MSKILVTGGTGFLSKYILDEIKKENEVVEVSRTGKGIIVDLSIKSPDLPQVDLVIHCAGKAHSVPRTEAEKQSFFDVNLIGTSNLLKGLDRITNMPRSFVFISTYGCESGNMINEEHPLNAKDPYGLSKIQAEELVKDWCLKNGVIYTILRLPLLVGENPPGNLGAMIKGIKKGYYFNIAGGKAKKSMVMATDVAKLIPKIAEVGGVYNLTDGYHPSFNELSSVIAKQLGRSNPINISMWVAKLMAKFGNLLGIKSPINSSKLNKIISDLTFDDSKARKMLNWKPNLVINNLKL